ncbi:response regulator [Paenibacillus sp. FSL R10-2736]|uniref:response regulator n=1 Tax=Paenibacillus sp. FSL R10-2736 TaxID=2954692 RepID=UPI0030F88BA5
MKVIIIDDEKAMHLILKRMLGKLEEVEMLGSFTDTASAFTYLSSHEVDLIFVDISMPRESGLEFAARLRGSGRGTRIVFITSHKEYALSAFEVYAFDYILKPVVQERLHETVHRAATQIHLELAAEANREPALSAEARISLLGGIEIGGAQRIKTKWKSRKSAELLGYLIIHKGRLVSRARLIEDIFGDMPQKNAEIYLNTTVYQLRKLLHTHGLKTHLHSESNHYAFNCSGLSVDILSFEDGCRSLAVINEANLEQAIELEQLYMGDLFGDHVYPWAWNEIERLSLMYSAFTRRLCVALLDKGETNTAKRLLIKLLKHNELDEEAHMLLMKTSALQNNKDALNRQYLQFADILNREIGIPPSLEVKSFYAQLLSGLG